MLNNWFLVLGIGSGLGLGLRSGVNANDLCRFSSVVHLTGSEMRVLTGLTIVRSHCYSLLLKPEDHIVAIVCLPEM